MEVVCTSIHGSEAWYGDAKLTLGDQYVTNGSFDYARYAPAD